MAGITSYNLLGQLDRQIRGPGSFSVGCLVANNFLTITVETDVGKDVFTLKNPGDVLSFSISGTTSIRIEATTYPVNIFYLDTTLNVTLTSYLGGAGGTGAGITVTVSNTVNVTDTGFLGPVRSTVVTVGTTAVPIPAAALANRKALLLQAAPDNAAIIYVGGSAVTADEAATGGIQLVAGASMPADLGVTAIVYGRSTQAGQKLIVFEAS